MRIKDELPYSPIDLDTARDVIGIDGDRDLYVNAIDAPDTLHTFAVRTEYNVYSFRFDVVNGSWISSRYPLDEFHRRLTRATPVTPAVTHQIHTGIPRCDMTQWKAVEPLAFNNLCTHEYGVLEDDGRDYTLSTAESEDMVCTLKSIGSSMR